VLFRSKPKKQNRGKGTEKEGEELNPFSNFDLQ
jgi:hypothetical protein